MGSRARVRGRAEGALQVSAARCSKQARLAVVHRPPIFTSRLNELTECVQGNLFRLPEPNDPARRPRR